MRIVRFALIALVVLAVLFALHLMNEPLGSR